MVYWKNFIKRPIYCIWILLAFVDGYPDPIDPRCTLPEIQPLRSDLHVYYRRTPSTSATVYSCQYTVEDHCSHPPCLNCDGGSRLNARYSVRTYSDITKSCLTAFSKNKFRDRYGNIHNLSQPKSSFVEKCDNGSLLDRTITINITKYEARMDAIEDIVVLKSGSLCKYSLGFCHDREMGTDVMWMAKNNTDIYCNHLTELIVEDVYYFILNQKTYAMIQSENGYLALELKDPKSYCGFIIWESIKDELLISEGPIHTADEGAIYKADDEYIINTHPTFFKDKQLLYDFLVKDCISKLGKKYKLGNDVENLTSLDGVRTSTGDKNVEFHLLVCYYLSIVNTSCFVGVMLYLFYNTYKKIYCTVDCTLNKRNSLTSAPYGSDLYDTVLY